MSRIPNVYVLHVWLIGRAVFAGWFAVTSFVGNIWFVQRSMERRILKSVSAAIAMTAASCLFIVVVPIWLFASLLVFGDRGDPVSWLFALMIWLSGVASDLAVLMAFKQRITRPVLLRLFAMNLVCVAVAVYQMVAYVIAHPPLA